MKERYTEKQGQYLAFVFYFTKIHGCALAEADLQRCFEVSPPAVHQMAVRFEEKGLIERATGKGRSIRLLIGREELPDLVWARKTAQVRLLSLSPAQHGTRFASTFSCGGAAGPPHLRQHLRRSAAAAASLLQSLEAEYRHVEVFQLFAELR